MYTSNFAAYNNTDQFPISTKCTDCGRPRDNIHPTLCPVCLTKVAPDYCERTVEYHAREIASLMLGICPASGLPLVYDNPVANVRPGRLACDMCDCFGWPTERKL